MKLELEMTICLRHSPQPSPSFSLSFQTGWSVKLKVTVGQLWPVGPTLGISALKHSCQHSHLDVTHITLPYLWGPIQAGFDIQVRGMLEGQLAFHWHVNRCDPLPEYSTSTCLTGKSNGAHRVNKHSDPAKMSIRVCWCRVNVMEAWSKKEDNSKFYLIILTFSPQNVEQFLEKKPELQG